MTPPNDPYELRYTRTGHRTHYVNTRYQHVIALCGTSPGDSHADWHGGRTGTEQRRAAQLPICRNCATWYATLTEDTP